MIRDAEHRWPPLGQFLNVDGARVHYIRRGSGPRLILIHGASGNLREWTFAHLDRLAKDFDVIAFDRPGHGFSERIPHAHSPHVQAAHLRKAAQQLDLLPAALLGHSYGGTIALTWACDAAETVERLILLCAPSHRWDGSAGWIYDTADAPLLGPLFSYLYPRIASQKLVKRALRGVFAPGTMPDGYGEHLGPGLAMRYKTVRANAADIARLKPFLIAQTPRYADLSMPLLQIHGTADRSVPIHIHAEPLKAAVPGSDLLRFEDVGHMPHHSRFEDTLDAIRRHLSE